MDLFDLGVTLLNSENGNCALGKKKVDLRCCLLVSSPKKHFGPAIFCFTVSVFCDFPPRLWVGCLLTKDTGRRKWIARKSWARSGYMERAKKRTTCRGLREDVKCGKQREAVLKKGVETNSWGQNESHPRGTQSSPGTRLRLVFQFLRVNQPHRYFLPAQQQGLRGHLVTIKPHKAQM